MRMRYPGLVFLALLSILTLSGSSVLAAKIAVSEAPAPSLTVEMLAALEGPMGPVLPGFSETPLTPGLLSSAECYNFDDNQTFNHSLTTGNGVRFIPPDPHTAAGLEHVINIGNCYIEWRLKNALVNVPQHRSGLYNPSPLNPVPGLFVGVPGGLSTYAFDPKVIYDQYSNRFVVVCLEQVPGPPLQSRILVAVSKGADPNGGWWLHSIDGLLNLPHPTTGVLSDTWADYPGIAVDDEAVYITTNQFSAAGAFHGSRVWLIQKAPTYAGPDGNISWAVYDAYGLSGASVDLGAGTTTMPTHMYGPEPVGVGTFLVSTGWSDGLTEYVAVIRLDNPTGVVAWNYQLLSVGDIDHDALSPPNASQLGSARTISTVAIRAMNAVWRNNNLYTCHTIRPPGGVEVNDATAHWYRLGTLNLAALAVADQGNVGAEDLGAGTHTFMPAVMVDVCDNMAVGFAASGPAIHPGAYYASRLAADPPGTIGGTMPLAVGTDVYVRTFSSSLTAASRWGDYSGLSICPVDMATFWVYNEYACTPGNPSTVSGVTEDGRWCTRVGSFFLCQPVSVAITAFDAVAKNGSVELRSLFRSDLGVQAVNVYRSGAEGEFRLIETVSTGGTSFTFTDDTVAPGATYRYQIGVVDGDGEVFSPIAKVTLEGVSVTLGQNSPNPFNPSTTISFTLPAREQVAVSIYDANGRLVRTLLDESRDYGTHSVTWDGRDDAGSTVGSGVYFYRLSAGKYSESKKMVMLK